MLKVFISVHGAGEIKNYTGVNAPYEAPSNPELVIDTESETVKECVSKIIDFLKVRKIIA
jgi:adenylylsulfate kinase